MGSSLNNSCSIPGAKEPVLQPHIVDPRSLAFNIAGSTGKGQVGS